MARNVTIKDIAERTGTSVTSVHRALYGRKGISEDLRAKILAEVEKSQYRMDEAASMLRRGQLHIDVLLPKPAGQERFYYKGLWDGIYRGAQEIGQKKVKVTYVETDRGIDKISESLEHLYDTTDESLDGLVTVCDDDKARDWIQRFIRRGTKVALVDRGVQIEHVCCRIEASSSDMGHLAVNVMDFLIHDEGGTLVLVSGPEHRFSYRLYTKAVRDKMRELHPTIDVQVINGYEEAAGRKTLKNLLQQGKVRGVIAGCARASYWVCDEISQLHMVESPSVVGMDMFVELVPFFHDGILKATIYQAHREHGEKALRYLYESLQNPYMQQEETMLAPISVVMKENYKYFL